MELSNYSKAEAQSSLQPLQQMKSQQGSCLRDLLVDADNWAQWGALCPVHKPIVIYPRLPRSRSPWSGAQLLFSQSSGFQLLLLAWSLNLDFTIHVEQKAYSICSNSNKKSRCLLSIINFKITERLATKVILESIYQSLYHNRLQCLFRIVKLSCFVFLRNSIELLMESNREMVN